MIYYKGKPQGAGASAYDLAKAQGFQGTEAEFAQDLAKVGSTDTYSKSETYTKTEVDNLVNSAGGIVVSATAPSKTNVLWIDTGNGGIAKYYDTSSKSWTTVKAVWG